MSAVRYDAIVIGGGINGLAAAATLSRSRKRVLVLERSSEIGGLARMVDVAPGFRAPLGPDGGWMSPQVARAAGISVPASTRPATSVALASGDAALAIPTDIAAAAVALRRFSERDASRWAAFTTRIAKLAGFLGALYQAPAPDVSATTLGDLASLLGLGRRFRALGREDMTELLRVLPMSVDDFLGDEFEHETIRAAVGAGGVRDIRQGPRSGGTTFVLLHHLVGASAGAVRSRDWWTSSPDALVAALATELRKRGVEVRVNAEVARIVVEDDAVAGVALANGDELSARVVISTADPLRTFDLVDPVWVDPELTHAIRNIKFRGATAIVHYALDALPEVRGLSTNDLASVVTLSPTLDAIERAYDDAKYGRVSQTPHVEVFVPSLRWPSLAPPGKHIVTARVQYVPFAPVGGELDVAKVTAAIERIIPGFSSRVSHTRALAPHDLASDFALTDGAMTHGELTLDQILFMRPVPGLARDSAHIDGLYVGGAGAHPGPGVLGGPGVLAARAALG